MKIDQLIAKASARLGSEYKVAKAIGATPQRREARQIDLPWSAHVHTTDTSTIPANRSGLSGSPCRPSQ